MRKFSVLLVASALAVAPAGLAFAQTATMGHKTVLGVSTGTDKDAKAKSEVNMTGRGTVDPTGKASGANPTGPAATTNAQVRTGGGTNVGRGNVDPTGKPSANVTGNADMRGSTGATMGRGNVDPTGKPMSANMAGSTTSRSSTMGSAEMRSSTGIKITQVDTTAKAKVRISRASIDAYERAKVAALNMPQSTQAEREARAAAIARADAMRM